MTHDHLFNQIVDEFQSGGITGWCPVEKALDLAATVLALRPKVITEIGVWGGRSLIPMALACKHVGEGIVIGIDPWSPEASTEGYEGKNAEWWGQQNHQRVYENFMGHIARLGLADIVKIQRAKSNDVAPAEEIELLHTDGQHSDQAVVDVDRYAAHVRVGGFTCLDDLDWDGGGVRRAEDRLIALGFRMLYKSGTGAIYQRISPPTNSTESQPARRGARGAVAASNSKRRAPA